MANPIRKMIYDSILFRVSSGEIGVEEANFPTDGHKAEFLRVAEPYFLKKNDMNNYNKVRSLQGYTY